MTKVQNFGREIHCFYIPIQQYICNLFLPICYDAVPTPVLAHTVRFQNGRGVMGMQPGVLLIGCLLAWYLVAMVMFWHGLRGPKKEAPLRMEGRLPLRAGQTILGVMDAPEMICFCIGTSEDHVHQEDTGS
jgi:hypothetical protein